MNKLLNPALQEGKLLLTHSLGVVKIERLEEDRVYCVSLDGKTRLTLSRTAASRRAITRDNAKRKAK